MNAIRLNEHPTETAKTSSTQSTETAKKSIELHSGPGIEHSEHQNGRTSLT